MLNHVQRSPNPEFQYFICHGSAQDNAIALTFDDGPHQRFTLDILAALSKGNMTATFFMTGDNIRQHKDLVKRVHESGHEIGNHSLSHPNGLLAGRKKILNELQDTRALIEDITGVSNRWYRPPYGIASLQIFSVCRQLDLGIVLWSINSYDYIKRKQPTIADRVIKKLRPGAIVLFHECHYKDPTRDYSSTSSALEKIAPVLARKNLSAVTISSLLGEETI